MAESTQLNKRSREENEENDNAKRPKSYSDILSILEEEEYGFESDPFSGSDIFTTIEQELLQTDGFGFGSDPVDDPVATGSGISASSSKEDEEDDKSSVIRHILEASDDELGIPSGDGGLINGSDFPVVEENGTDGGDFPFAISDGLWEFEDEAANYYSLIQSEIFM
ncbi:hypothetical protein K7X08_021120 [Anisodus acutangulus]|uniref:Uncharacterized protein n=1 Tax=Anisodus acutangulus TaxID=402998 RepID=A0A9Q1M1K4_9SOLA|nr:hypothetical protein K7X08_021120 [Anisodus acutangulus]